ncbi:uncharacterized protein SPAPADRAFT_50699 [Spathaspora passalidarum NRRL Y-27907]|uniref:Uncharacterized protein n=1 Tax=Spathaspora passalidarum (strain NRRL Y-27907 / 11-Y1) TaxID=619300 RepID=G3APD2_SPAPN|nr:uncharacterized protein SPAPADRAFT_50699 [Spathaspora passalidarum NRRL Y-27907]EGW32109.1 hypothetical protein SPAPADRAFT_50699 [Spathaspora passalidarum NRRL Y-27907]
MAITFVDLPDHIIQRVIYFRYVQDESFIHLFPLFLTCQALYAYYHMLYTLKPIIATDTKHPHAVPKRVLQGMSNDLRMSIRKMILFLPATIDLHRFNLTSLTLDGGFACFYKLYELPNTITSLKFVVSSSKGYHRWKLDFREVPFKLVVFKFKYLLWGSKSSFLNPMAIFTSQFSAPPLQLSLFLLHFITSQKDTLKYLDIEMFSIGLIFGTRTFPIFPTLKLVKVDQMSEMNKPFISQVLNNGQTVLLIINTLKSEIIKLEISAKDSSVSREKFHIEDRILSRLKSQLAIP